MTEWFDQRYISRDEHRQIVDYYRKQVARLYHELSELRSGMEALGSRETAPRPLPRQAADGDNIIRLDFRRRR
jgi:hypothetical protein